MPSAVRAVVIPALLSREGGDLGGTAVYVRSLQEQLAARGWQVTILGYGPRDRDSGQFRSIVHRPAARGRDLSWALWRMRRHWTFPRDTVIHVQRPDHAFGFLHGPWPLVVSFHGRHLRSVAQRGGAGAKLVYRHVERRAGRRADALVFVSRADMRAVLATHPQFAPQSHHVPIGVDRELFCPGDRDGAREMLGLPLDVVGVAYVGRLAREKNVPALVSAIEWVPGAELWVTGTGTEEERCRRLAGPRVRFLGALPRAQLPLFLRAADLLALASHHEGFPTVALEAWACGRPVVAPPVGDLPELLSDERGTLAEDGRPASLAAAIRTQLGKQRGVSSAQAARETTREYAWDVIADRIEQVYGQAIDHSRARRRTGREA